MPKGSRTAQEVLALVLMGKQPAWLGQSEFYLALHTADPSQGDQSSHEVAYAGYGRVPVGCACWILDGETAANAEPVTFPVSAGSGAPPTATHVSVGIARSGGGQVLYAGRMKRSLTIRQNQRLNFPAGTLVLAEG